MTSSDLRKFEKHPTLGHSQAPPPLDIVRVTSSDLRKFEKHPHSWTFTKGGGPTLGPMLKSLHRGPKGGGPDPLDPPPGSATGPQAAGCRTLLKCSPLTIPSHMSQRAGDICSVFLNLGPSIWFGLLGFNAAATARVISRR